eukprot:jgi/Tetstr1/466681/TSEL_011169.t1
MAKSAADKDLRACSLVSDSGSYDSVGNTEEAAACASATRAAVLAFQPCGTTGMDDDDFWADEENEVQVRPGGGLADRAVRGNESTEDSDQEDEDEDEDGGNEDKGGEED